MTPDVKTAVEKELIDLTQNKAATDKHVEAFGRKIDAIIAASGKLEG